MPPVLRTPQPKPIFIVLLDYNFLTTEGGSLFEGSSGKEELSCSIPGGVALIRSVFYTEVAFIFGIFQ